ncbi:hypothetical protein E0Z10_g5914 [Xylaria hypoxylon]|uniref:N-terminal of MaoC-like dehydratase domain-containing protein n=1 Tax=Xylaria hypoxylon TaxID=37992 RepID=A0A4Z0YZT1_9PEZI|nr:hypothetical protein E0Z10_g5914 [Xylaria hypoxylon]
MSRSLSSMPLGYILSRPLLSCTTRIPRRHQSTTAAEAAASLLSRFEGKTRTATQVLDGNQLQKLSLTLGGGVEDELGLDGTDASYNAPAPFSRRMWAGGRMQWLGHGVEIRVGDQVTEETRLVSATPKRSRDGGEMVLVLVRKEFCGPRGLALVDERSWIFRPETMVTSPAAEGKLREAIIRGPSAVKDVPQDGAYPQRQLRWSPTGLFRFSALTFNGHKIHYDPTWSTAVEGHPACVVHGPINLISMLDYWRDHCAAEGRGVKEISYRAVSPIYAGEMYGISAEETGESRWEVLVRKEGKACMSGQILGA